MFTMECVDHPYTYRFYQFYVCLYANNDSGNCGIHIKTGTSDLGLCGMIISNCIMQRQYNIVT